MRFKTGESVKDATPDEISAIVGDHKPLRGPFVAVRHRAFGSPSVHFGPFVTLDELFAWSEKHGLVVAVMSLVDPESDESTWWNG